MLTITRVASKRMNFHDGDASSKHYCRLSQPVDMNEITEDDYLDLLDLVCDACGLYVNPYCTPGGYFAHYPSIRTRGLRMIVYQQAGLDI